MFTSAWWMELGIQVLVAVLTTLVSMLTYDRAVAAPRLRRLRERVERRLDEGF